jgi:antirestriction protein ArdC
MLEPKEKETRTRIYFDITKKEILHPPSGIEPWAMPWTI